MTVQTVKMGGEINQTNWAREASDTKKTDQSGVTMNRPNLKSADEQIVDDPAAAMDRTRSALKKLIALPKSALEGKQGHAKKKRR